jgi:hypothetical protein
MKNKIKKGELFCSACGGTGVITDPNNKNQIRYCPRCGAHLRISNFEINVEGQVADEVKDVVSHILNQHSVFLNNDEKLIPEINDLNVTNEKWDVFISHASEDKENFVKELADVLNYLGVKVWYDEFTLKVGMSLVNSIDAGLKKSRFGIVVLSKSFISKPWTDYEKKSLVTRELNGKQLILPIWHNISKNEVIEFSAFLADKVALNTSIDKFQIIILKLLEVIRPDIYQNYQRRLMYLEKIKNSKVEYIKRNEINVSEIRHQVLSKHVLNRIKNIYYTIGKYFNSSLEDSINNFKRDIDPEREIKIWEIITSTFSDFTDKYSINDEIKRKDIAFNLLLFSIGQPYEKTKLTDEEQLELYEMWGNNFHTSE